MLIAFDLDDTLYKEMDFADSGRKAVARVAAATGKFSFEEAMAVLAASASMADGFDRLAESSKGALSIADMLDAYRNHEPEIELPAESAFVLSELKRGGHTLVLITDGRATTQRAKIRALGLERFFEPESIIISGETGADKNDPLPFRLAAERYPAETERIYVGDNPAKDFRHPNLMGWRTIQLNDTKGVNVHRQDIDAGPEYHAAEAIDTLPRLLDIL